MTSAGVRTAARLVAVGALLVLQSAWWFHPVPLSARAIGVALLALGVVSPPSAVLAFAGLAPLTTVLASLTGADYGGPRLLEQLALSCVIGALIRGGDRDAPGSRLAWPALLLAAIAIASACTLLPTRALDLGPDLGSLGSLARTFFDGSYGRSDPFWAPVLAVGVILVGALLGCTVERAVRRDPGLAQRLLLMALVGHAGASLLGLYRLTASAMASGDFVASFPLLLARGRVSMQTDVNAAASGLLLALVAAFGLVRGERMRGLTVVALAGVTLLGLWITGSRAGLVAGLLSATVGATWVAARRGGAARRVAVGCVLLMVAAGGLLVAAYPRGRNPTVQHSVASRLIMLRAGLEMFRSAPVFGIGPAQFLERSGSIAGEALAAFGQRRENAHNNFVQVLAEQGLAGLTALILLLAVVFIGAIRAELTSPDGSRLWLAVAVLASILTWMTGHPLLVPEYALVFWFFVGILAGTSAPLRPSSLRRSLLAVTVIAATIPVRANLVRDAADFEHRGFGLSGWLHDDKQRYREGTHRFSIFLPTANQPNLVPLRRAPGVTGTLVVEFRSRRGVVATTSLSTDEWQLVSIDLPSARRRFEQIDVVVRPATGQAAAVQVRVGRAALAP